MCLFCTFLFFLKSGRVCVYLCVCFLVQVWPFLDLDEKPIHSGNVNLDDKK